MADKYAQVQDPNYVFRGHRLGKGTVVRLTSDQLKAAGDHNPPRLKEVPKPDREDGIYDIRPEAFRAQLQAAEAGQPPKRPDLKQQQ